MLYALALSATHTYAKLLHDFYHPNKLRNALDQDCWLDYLWLGLELIPNVEKIIGAELTCLKTGNIPLFTTTPTSSTLYYQGNEKIAGIICWTSYQAVANRIAKLSPDDLKKQLSIIDDSLDKLGKENSLQELFRSEE